MATEKNMWYFSPDQPELQKLPGYWDALRKYPSGAPLGPEEIAEVKRKFSANEILHIDTGFK